MRLDVWCLSFFSLLPLSLSAARRPLPLVFEPDVAGGFVGRNAGGNVTITPAHVQFGAIRMRLAGARPRTRLEGLDLLPGKSFYYIGNDPGQWRTGVPQYGRVAYRDVYPGVDLVLYGSAGQLEYDLILAPQCPPQPRAPALRRRAPPRGGGQRRSANRIQPRCVAAEAAPSLPGNRRFAPRACGILCRHRARCALRGRWIRSGAVPGDRSGNRLRNLLRWQRRRPSGRHCRG